MAYQATLAQTGPTTTMTISVEDFVKLKQVPINRKSEDRVSKMTSSYEGNYNSGMSHLLAIVHIGIVTQNFVDPVTGYSYIQGEQYILDGNTRKNYWLKNEDKWIYHPSGLTAIIHTLQNFQQVQQTYDSLDSSKSAKITSEKIQGEFNRHKFYPKQELLQRGHISLGLKWAHRGPKEPEMPLNQQVPICLNALQEFDAIEETIITTNGKTETYTITTPRIPRLASSPIYSAILTALRLFPKTPRLYEFISKFISQDENSIRIAINANKVNPYQIIAIEWLGWSDQRSKRKGDSPLWLDGNAGQTPNQHQKKQMDFLLHWIQVYLDNPNYEVQFSNGIKATAWGKADPKNPSSKPLIGGWERFYENSSKTRKMLSKIANNKILQHNFNFESDEGLKKLERLIIGNDKKLLQID
jgi:hypothetical protein